VPNWDESLRWCRDCAGGYLLSAVSNSCHASGWN